MEGRGERVEGQGTNSGQLRRAKGTAMGRGEGGHLENGFDRKHNQGGQLKGG